MYNHFAKGTEAYDAIEYEAKPALKNLDQAQTDIEAAFEAMADCIDVVCGEREEWQEEAENNEKEIEKLQARIDELDVDKDELINLLSQGMLAGEAIREFCNKQLVKLGALNETTDSDDSDGADGDDSGQDNSGQSDGKASTGVTRPQIP